MKLKVVFSQEAGLSGGRISTKEISLTVKNTDSSSISLGLERLFWRLVDKANLDYYGVVEALIENASGKLWQYSRTGCGMEDPTAWQITSQTA